MSIKHTLLIINLYAECHYKHYISVYIDSEGKGLPGISRRWLSLIRAMKVIRDYVIIERFKRTLEREVQTTFSDSALAMSSNQYQLILTIIFRQVASHI